MIELNSSKIHVVNQSSSQTVTGVVVNEKAQVSSGYRKEIRKAVYYINKFGLSSHLKKCIINIDPDEYLRGLYGKILYVLQIDKDNREFLRYKDLLESIMA